MHNVDSVSFNFKHPWPLPYVLDLKSRLLFVAVSRSHSRVFRKRWLLFHLLSLASPDILIAVNLQFRPGVWNLTRLASEIRGWLGYFAYVATLIFSGLQWGSRFSFWQRCLHNSIYRSTSHCRFHRVTLHSPLTAAVLPDQVQPI